MSPPDDLSENVDLVLRLGLIPFLSGSPDESRKALLRSAAELSLPNGHQIRTRTDRADMVYLVLDGFIGSFADEDAKSAQLVDLIGPNSFIGLPEVFLGHDYQHTYKTLSKAKIIMFPAASFVATLRADWNLVKSMMGSLSQRIHGLVIQIDSLKSHTAEQRLAFHFLRHMESNATGRVFSLPYDKKDLAAHLGLAPESLSRALNRLKQRDITLQGRTITVKDPQRLIDLIDSEGLSI